MASSQIAITAPPFARRWQLLRGNILSDEWLEIILPPPPPRSLF